MYGLKSNGRSSKSACSFQGVNGNNDIANISSDKYKSYNFV